MHRYHPDKPTGSVEKFRDIEKAYRILTDEIARANYERYVDEGEDGQQDHDDRLPASDDRRHSPPRVLPVAPARLPHC